MDTFGKLDGDDRELGKQIAALEQQIEDADRRLRAAGEAARDADGRDEPAADRERAEADSALEGVVKALGVTEKALPTRRHACATRKAAGTWPGSRSISFPPRASAPSGCSTPSSSMTGKGRGGKRSCGPTAKRPSWTPLNWTGPACSWRTCPARSWSPPTSPRARRPATFRAMPTHSTISAASWRPWMRVPRPAASPTACTTTRGS